MLRYYTTPETRAALIAESNRIVAARAAAKAATKGADTSQPASLDSVGSYSQWGLLGSMTYAERETSIAPTYQGLMSFFALAPAR